MGTNSHFSGEKGSCFTLGPFEFAYLLSNFLMADSTEVGCGYAALTFGF